MGQAELGENARRQLTHPANVHLSPVVPAKAGTHIPETGDRGPPLSRGRPFRGRDYSLISPRLMLAPSVASTVFLLRPLADISTRYVPEPSSSLSNLKSP